MKNRQLMRPAGVAEDFQDVGASAEVTGQEGRVVVVGPDGQLPTGELIMLDDEGRFVRGGTAATQAAGVVDGTIYVPFRHRFELTFFLNGTPVPGTATVEGDEGTEYSAFFNGERVTWHEMPRWGDVVVPSWWRY